MASTAPRKSVGTRKVTPVRKPTAARTQVVDSVSKSTPKSAVKASTGDYVVPFLHTHVPAPVVQAGFWGGLIGTVALGVVEAPMAAAIGVGVLVARHRRSL